MSRKYVGVDIRLDLTVRRPVSERRLEFHNALAAACLEDAVERLGGTLIEAVGFSALYRAPESAVSRLAEKITKHGSVDCVLLDLSDNEPQLARDIFIAELIDAISKVGQSGLCSLFVVLLPYAVGSVDDEEAENRLPSEMRLAAERASDKGYRLFVLDQNEAVHVFPASAVAPRGLKEEYAKLCQSMSDNPEAALGRRLIRRLGHYRPKRGAEGGEGCRRFSYLVDRGSSELGQILDQLRHDVASDTGTIIFDGMNNSWFAEPIASLATRNDLEFYPVSEMETRPRKFLKDLASASNTQPILLAVDVVDTGQTVRKHLRRLQELGIPHSRNVIAALAMNGPRELQVGGQDYVVWACTQGTQDHVSVATCPQCELGLRYTSDQAGETAGIRSFDFWDMSGHVRWEPEPDVPPGRPALQLIPDFNEVLERYGDWLGYKMATRLSQNGSVNYCVVYPEQAGASAVARALRLRVGRHVPFVSIPDRHITAVRTGGKTWDAIISDAASEPWYLALLQNRAASGVVVDVLNVTGGTYRALQALLEVVGMPVFCYFPMFNRDTAKSKVAAYPVPVRTLYEWFGPTA